LDGEISGRVIYQGADLSDFLGIVWQEKNLWGIVQGKYSRNFQGEMFGLSGRKWPDSMQDYKSIGISYDL